jgi:hypothetical protein
MVHAKEQEAAAQHVGSGMGKNDEPIGFCTLSLNEMLEHTRTGAGVKLMHPKGKDKACGTIFVRLRAVPRLTEDEIASNLQARDAELPTPLPLSSSPSSSSSSSSSSAQPPPPPP